jgi:hypothetical protein
MLHINSMGLISALLHTQTNKIKKLYAWIEKKKIRSPWNMTQTELIKCMVMRYWNGQIRMSVKEISSMFNVL